MRNFLALIAAGLLAGCAVTYEECAVDTPGTPEYEQCRGEVAEYRRQVDRNNLALCRALYRQHNVPMISTSRGTGRSKDLTPLEVRQELSQNQCRRYLGDYWETY